MPKISVIIPCYNAESYLEKCLDSVVNQTYGIENLEVICINDASTDATLNILCKYEERYPESFLIINNEVNTKQGYARNIGIQCSTGEYLHFIDSDDYVDPSIIEKLYSQMTKSDYDYVSCRFYRVSQGRSFIVDNYTEDVIVENIIDTVEKRKAFILDEGSTLGCWATLYKKSFITDNNIHFAEGIVYEDLLWLGMLRFYVKHSCIIPERLYYYVNYNNSSVIVKKNSPHHYDRLKVMIKYFNECIDFGFYESYKDEIEMHFLQIFYVNSLTLFADRFDYVPASVLNHMLSTIRNLMPEYKNNPYIKNCTGLYATVINIIEANPTSQKSWDEIINALREL